MSSAIEVTAEEVRGQVRVVLTLHGRAGEPILLGDADDLAGWRQTLTVPEALRLAASLTVACEACARSQS